MMIFSKKLKPSTKTNKDEKNKVAIEDIRQRDILFEVAENVFFFKCKHP